MKRRLDEYDIRLINEIYDTGSYPNIITGYDNTLESVWFRNKKDKIQMGTLISLRKLKSNAMGLEGHNTNVYFDITPEKAREIIKALEKTLKNRKKV